MEDDDRTIVYSNPDPSPLPDGYRINEFEIRGKLGQGGFSIVYRAWDESLRRMVALKEYMPIGVARRVGHADVAPASARHGEAFTAGLQGFMKEAQTLAQFDHPALVRVHRSFEANGTAFMAMQLVEGKTLKEVVLALPAPPDERWLLNLLDPLTAALQVVHRESIYHRDIAPDNVMILAGSHGPLLLDFGAARQLIGDAGDAPTAMLKGGYAPIEQYPESGMRQGPWTDVYALAGVVYWIIAKQKPPEAVGRTLKDHYQPLASRFAGKYSARFLHAIDHALMVKPQDRPASVEAFRKALGLGENLPVPAAPAPKPRRLVVAAASAAALVVAAGITVWLTSSPPAPAVASSPDKPASSIDPVADAGGSTRDAAPGAAPKPAPSAGPADTSATPATPPAATQPATPMPSTPPQAAPPPGGPAGEFDRVLSAAAPALQVTLSVASPTLRAGVDPLQIQLRASRAGHFYLLLHDTDGQVRLLFPNSAERDNRIAAGATVRLPPRVTDSATGLSATTTLTLSEPLGPARLLAIVSPQPLDFDAVTVKQGEPDVYRLLMQPRQGQAAEVAGRPMYAGRAVCEGGGAACSGEYGAADRGIEVRAP